MKRPRMHPGPVSAIALALCVLITMPAAAQRSSRVRCDPVLLDRDVRYLASDELEGRAIGSEGLERALYAIASRFRQLGLAPIFPERVTEEEPAAGYLQRFKVDPHPASANVIGLLRSRPGSAGGTVILGAHADHLGRERRLRGDRIYNGADDNASGVASLLSIAAMMAAQPPTERVQTVLFIVFSGEESGLLGSGYYVAHPIVPLADVTAMINLDEIGRMRDEHLVVFGAETAREFPNLLTGLNSAFGLDIEQQHINVAGSDHISFYTQDIPVLHFFTGLHEDHHKVTDEADRINYRGLETLTNYVGELVRYLSYRGRPLTFVPASAAQAAELQKTAELMQGPKRRVSLGFMPDFATEAAGVKVGQISPGSAAADAGLQQGDLITAINDEAVTGLADYAGLLRMYEPGDQVTVTVKRGGVVLKLAAHLQERR